MIVFAQKRKIARIAGGFVFPYLDKARAVTYN